MTQQRKTEKRCCGCGETLPIEKFYQYDDLEKGRYYSSRCKKCQSEFNRVRYHETKGEGWYNFAKRLELCEKSKRAAMLARMIKEDEITLQQLAKILKEVKWK